MALCSMLVRDTYNDNLRVIFDQWPKLNLDLDVLNYKKKS